MNFLTGEDNENEPGLTKD